MAAELDVTLGSPRACWGISRVVAHSRPAPLAHVVVVEWFAALTAETSCYEPRERSGGRRLLARQDVAVGLCTYRPPTPGRRNCFPQDRRRASLGDQARALFDIPAEARAAAPV
jgi:hypothetical protein